MFYFINNCNCCAVGAAAGQFVQLPVHAPARVPSALLPAADARLFADADQSAQGLRRRAAPRGRRIPGPGQEDAHPRPRGQGLGKRQKGQEQDRNEPPRIPAAQEGKQRQEGSVISCTILAMKLDRISNKWSFLTHWSTIFLLNRSKCVIDLLFSSTFLFQLQFFVKI